MVILRFAGLIWRFVVPDFYFFLTGMFCPVKLVIMFVRKKTYKKSKGVAIQIVESTRDGKHAFACRLAPFGVVQM